MKCPICGEEISEGKHKCLKCGYEVHELSTSVREQGEEPAKTVDIDPSQVYISGGSRTSSGSLFEDIFGGGLFGGLFDGLFGGFFDGFDDNDEDEVEYDDFGSPISDVYGSEVVELSAHDVEHIDESASTETRRAHNGAQGDYGKKTKENKDAKGKRKRGKRR
ncbi:MAG: zinc ribbon domain-containing protein [Clostridia bacterium]|nr:zinc ribbon domain-containing protein [Clostridia bacterium]